MLVVYKEEIWLRVDLKPKMIVKDKERMFLFRKGGLSVRSDSQEMINYISSIYERFDYSLDITIITKEQISTSDVCILTSKNNCIVYSNEEGLVRSCISGIITSLEEKYPIHAACLSIKNNNFLLVGAHGHGKSTLSMELINRYEKEVKILTDDWCSCTKDLKITTPNTGINIDQKSMNKVVNITGNDNFYFHNKKYFIPNKNFGDSFCNVFNGINSIILLGNKNRVIDEDKSIEDAAKYIVDCSYHYPYTSTKLYDSHIEFWIEVINHVGCIEYENINTKGNYNDPKGFLEIINGLIL